VTIPGNITLRREDIMIIRDNHRLEGDRIDFVKSQNHGAPFDRGLPDSIVIHYTAGRSAESSVQTLCNPSSKASAHVVVGRDGSIVQLVPFDTISWHAGKSSHGGRSGFNKYSIGIEIDNAGRLTKGPGGYTAWFGQTYSETDVIEAIHRNESTPSFWHRYTEDQIDAVIELCLVLVDSYSVSEILGHEEIAPARKVDPGPAFPLDKLRERVLQRDRSDEGEAEESPMHQAAIVTASKLNIRAAPRKSSPTIAPPLLKGTVVDILKETNGWYNVEVTTRGWVKREYVRT
jgi:N-acetylmuramoyl-L-alanine amidase